MADRFDEIRASISQVDEEIIAAVNARLTLVGELWQIKEERGLPLFDPEREQALRAGLVGKNTGPLSRSGIEQVLDTLLELMRSELRPHDAR
jgi:chorismate mutase